MSATSDTTAGALVLYDGDCGICSHVVTCLSRRTGAAVSWRPWQREMLLPAGVSAARLEREIVVVGAGGEVQGGARAFAAILRHVRGARWLGALLELPGICHVADAGYSMFARNRARVSRILGLTSCRIPARNGPPSHPKKES